MHCNVGEYRGFCVARFGNSAAQQQAHVHSARPKSQLEMHIISAVDFNLRHPSMEDFPSAHWGGYWYSRASWLGACRLPIPKELAILSRVKYFEVGPAASRRCSENDMIFAHVDGEPHTRSGLGESRDGRTSKSKIGI